MTTRRSLTLSLLPSLATFGVMLASQVSLDRAIGLAGTVFALLTFVIQQIQNRNPPRRTVLFLPKSRSTFARNIWRGLMESLASRVGIQVRTTFPDNDPDDPFGWQLDRLQAKETRSMSGLVIIPAADDEKLWSQLALLARAGMTIVVVDVRPPDKVFIERGVPVPKFVGSDFSSGGEIIASLLVEELEADPIAALVVAVGPDISAPARERCGIVLYQLAAHGHTRRVETIHLPSWNPSDCGILIADAIVRLVSERAPRTLAFCGNDNILANVNLELSRRLPLPDLASVSLIGYDGALQDDGSLVVSDCMTAIATIDTLPQQQGSAAADYILDAYEGSASEFNSRLIEPALRRVMPRQ